MKHRYLKDVSTLKIDLEKCTGCGMCIEVCPHRVFTLNNSKAEIIDQDSCMECGACVKNCPFNALEVKPGVGCAAAIIRGWLTGTEPSCDCPNESDGSCC
ncbi:MAG TPA: ferredoxin [Pelotomaculum sp.]|nr:ferredoxin [Pelotomaculum sp.]